MKYKWTPLNISAYIFLSGCILYTIINYSQLSEGEGWGVVAMVGLTGFGLSAVAVDYLIRRYMEPGKIRIIVCSVIAIIYAVVLWFGGRL